MEKKFDYEGARKAGYSDKEIDDFLQKTKKESTPEESKKKGFFEKIMGIPAQIGISVGQRAVLPYEIATEALKSKEAQQVPYRENLFADIERLQEQKAMGQWDEKDQALYDKLKEEAANPRKSEKHIKTADIGVRGLAEKVTGKDLQPKGVLEKAASWYGWLKNPFNLKEIAKVGVKPSNFVKSLMPNKEMAQSLGAGFGLELAEQGSFGPMGTIGAAVLGDLIGGGITKAGKGIVNVFTKPKELLAKGVAKLSNSKDAIVKDLNLAEKGKKFIKDIGSLTNNNMVQMIQSRLAASGLTGKPLEGLRKKMTQEIVDAYEKVADTLGKANFENFHEAGTVVKEGIEKIRDISASVYRGLYKTAREAAKGDLVKFEVPGLVKKLKNLRDELKPGVIKSPQQKEVIDKVESLISEMVDEQGLKGVPVENLLNNKIALNDIIDYEVQGGAKQLLKSVVNDIDEALISHGKLSNQEFLKNYTSANQRFKKHAETFRNRNISNFLKNQDPEKIMALMNSTQGIRHLKEALGQSFEGKQLFKDLKRLKFDNLLGDNMKNNVTEQLKTGKFLSILENPKNDRLIKELLDPPAYKSLKHLQKHVGEIAESAQKFFNASQSATAGLDMGAVGSILMGVVGALTGNPWMAGAGAKVAGLVLGGRKIAKLMADPIFLSLVEDAIAASKKNDPSLMKRAQSAIMQRVKVLLPEETHPTSTP